MKRSGKNTHKKELHKKGLNDPDNHDCVVSHSKPDILECEVKWALGTTAANKTLSSQFQILEDDDDKVLQVFMTQITTMV